MREGFHSSRQINNNKLKNNALRQKSAVLRNGLRKILRNEKAYNLAKINSYNGDLSKRWYVSFSILDTDTGKQVWKKEFISSKLKTIDQRLEHGRKMAHIINELLISGELLKKQNFKTEKVYLISEQLEAALLSFKGSIKYRTFQSYRAFSKRFISFCNYHNKRLLFDIDRRFVFNFLQHFYANKANNTYNKYLSFLVGFFSKIEEINFYDFEHNPAKGIKLKKRVSSVKEIWSKNELKIYFDYTRKNDQDLYLLSLMVFEMFWRPQELIELKCGNVDLNRGVITIDQGQAKKAAGFGTITSHVLPLLKKHISKSDFYLFGKNLKANENKIVVQRVFERQLAARKFLKLPKHCTLYRLKHTGNTVLKRLGYDLDLIREKNRHHDIKMTEIYIKETLPQANKDLIEFPEWEGLEF